MARHVLISGGVVTNAVLWDGKVTFKPVCDAIIQSDTLEIGDAYPVQKKTAAATAAPVKESTFAKVLRWLS